MAVQAVKRPRRRVISLPRLVKRISIQFGKEAALLWTKALLGYQKQINEAELRSAIASGSLDQIAAVIGPAKLQDSVAKAVEPPFRKAIQVIGMESAKVLTKHGIEASFSAAHPNVILFARQQAADLVVNVPKEVKQIIAEVIARGAERGLTVAEQARAIKEVVGLPPNWAQAPSNFAVELQSGNTSAALNRKLSGKLKQQIRRAAKNGTLDDAFIRKAMTEYTETLISHRAVTIARTETIRAANFGLTESWQQARAQGVLPPRARRFWIITEDSRLSPEHARIPGMNSAGRGINEPFLTPDGVFMHPPSRPNCRCSIGLGFPRSR